MNGLTWPYSFISRHGRLIRMATHLMEEGVGLVVSSHTFFLGSTLLTRPPLVASDMELKNLTTAGLRGAAFAISQCTRFSGAPGVGNCTNSEFQIRNVEIDGLNGDSKSTRVASLQCSAVAPCTNITMANVGLHLTNGTAAADYLCGNVVNPTGFNCTGTPCVGGSATGEC